MFEISAFTPIGFRHLSGPRVFRPSPSRGVRRHKNAGLMLTNFDVFLCFRITMPRAEDWFELGQDVALPARFSITPDQDDIASFSNRDIVHSEPTSSLNQEVGSYVAKWHLRSFKDSFNMPEAELRAPEYGGRAD